MNVLIKKQIFSSKNYTKNLKIIKIAKTIQNLTLILHYFQSQNSPFVTHNRNTEKQLVLFSKLL